MSPVVLNDMYSYGAGRIVARLLDATVNELARTREKVASKQRKVRRLEKHFFAQLGLLRAPTTISKKPVEAGLGTVAATECLKSPASRSLYTALAPRLRIIQSIDSRCGILPSAEIHGHGFLLSASHPMLALSFLPRLTLHRVLARSPTRATSDHARLALRVGTTTAALLLTESTISSFRLRLVPRWDPGETYESAASLRDPCSHSLL